MSTTLIATKPTTNGHAHPATGAPAAIGAPPATVPALRKTALVAGILYLLTFVSIPSPFFLYDQVRNNPEYLLGPGPDTAALVGGILEIIVALAGIGTAVALYPVVKRQSEGVALGLVGARVVESSTIFADVV